VAGHGRDQQDLALGLIAALHNEMPQIAKRTQASFSSGRDDPDHSAPTAGGMSQSVLTTCAKAAFGYFAPSAISSTRVRKQLAKRITMPSPTLKGAQGH